MGQIMQQPNGLTDAVKINNLRSSGSPRCLNMNIEPPVVVWRREPGWY
jgi:hypothetical protein